MFVFLQVIFALALLWAVVGSFLYGFLLDGLGWNKFNLEVKWMLFLGLTLILAGITAPAFMLVFRAVARIRRAVLNRRRV